MGESKVKRRDGRRQRRRRRKEGNLDESRVKRRGVKIQLRDF